MRDEQAERLIDVLARVHQELNLAFRYFRDNADKWIVWLSSGRGRT